MVRNSIHDQLLRRLGEPRRFLQVLAGPRQDGLPQPRKNANVRE
jgi:hypothetical protein